MKTEQFKNILLREATEEGRYYLAKDLQNLIDIYLSRINRIENAIKNSETQEQKELNIKTLDQIKPIYNYLLCISVELKYFDK